MKKHENGRKDQTLRTKKKNKTQKAQHGTTSQEEKRTKSVIQTSILIDEQ